MLLSRVLYTFCADPFIQNEGGERAIDIIHSLYPSFAWGMEGDTYNKNNPVKVLGSFFGRKFISSVLKSRHGNSTLISWDGFKGINESDALKKIFSCEEKVVTACTSLYLICGLATVGGNLFERSKSILKDALFQIPLLKFFLDYFDYLCGEVISLSHEQNPFSVFEQYVDEYDTNSDSL